jgi:hypothetical protein
VTRYHPRNGCCFAAAQACRAVARIKIDGAISVQGVLPSLVKSVFVISLPSASLQALYAVCQRLFCCFTKTNLGRQSDTAVWFYELLKADGLTISASRFWP